MIPRTRLAVADAIGGMGAPAVPAATVDAIRGAFSNTLILSGGFRTLETIDGALAVGEANLVAIGHPIFAYPDCIEQLRAGLPLAEPDPATFFVYGPKVYIDDPGAA